MPGTTAASRIDRWLAKEASAEESFADSKGVDAYTFEPIESPYLEVTEMGFRVRTPYSKTVIEELRLVSHAHWEGDGKVWLVPFRAYQELRRRWPKIEAAAKRNEPGERGRRAAERKFTAEGQPARRRTAERKRRRYPVEADIYRRWDSRSKRRCGVSSSSRDRRGKCWTPRRYSTSTRGRRGTTSG